VESASLLVLGEDARVARSEAEAGLAFPVVPETVDLVELDRSVAIDEVGEHATSADC
jgi:hypothetical protein